MFRRIVVLFFLTFGIAGALFSTSGEHIPSPSQELGPADITVQLANKAARETAAHEQQNLHEKLQKSRQVQNKDYSKLIRSLYGRHQKASTQQIRHMDKFLEQARAFRNKDGSLSLRTVQRLLKANPDFTNLKGSSTEMIRRVSHEIKAYDQSTAREGRLFKQVNDLRTIAKIKKLKAHKPKAIRSITRPTAKTLKSEAVTQKRALVNELLKSGKFKSKAAIQAAVEARNPAVSKVVHLERKIQSFDRLIKAQPLNRARYHGSRAAQSVKETLLAMDVVQRGRTLASRLPGNQTLLDAYRTRRIEIFREFNQEGKYKNWKEVREAVKAGKSQDPRIQELRALDKKIQRVRYDLLRQKLPNIADSSRFSKRWGEVNSKINELKAIKAHLKKQPVVDQGALKSVRLHQKRAYLKQAKLQLQHDLLANKKFSSLKAIQKAVAGGSSLDPRISSLKRIQISEAKLAPKITRSVSAKVGAANRQYKAAAANHKPLIARASESVKTAAKQGVESIKKGWEYTKGASKDGVKWVKAKHSNGWEYTRQKGGKAWDTVKVRTSDGWEWARSRSQDAKGWAKGKADSGWKYVGEKTRSLKALTTAKAEQFKTGSIEKARAIYNESLSKASSVKEGISKQVQKASQRINDASKATSSRVRDTKNAAVNKARGAKDAAVNKARGAKDAAVNRARGAKDAAVNKARGAKDAVVNKAKGAKDAAVNKARSAKNAVANRANQTGEALKSSARSAQAGVKSGWEYTKGKTRGGIEYIKAKSVDGWQYTKVKAADGWNVTRMKTADGWEWARNRAQSTSGWAKGKTQAGWKYLGAKADGVKALAQTKATQAKNWTVEKANGAYETTRAKTVAVKETLLGKSKGAWEIVKTKGANGVETIKARSSDGWNYTKQKAGDGWKVAKIRTGDGWEWAKARTSDAGGWAKGKADAGWKYVGEKGQALKAKSASAVAQTQKSLSASAQAASKRVAGGVDWLKGKSIQAFEVSKTYAGKAASSTIASGKAAGKAFAQRVNMGQTLAGHQWVKPAPAAPSSSTIPPKPASPSGMPSQKAPLFHRTPNVSTQSGAVAKAGIFSKFTSKAAPKPSPTKTAQPAKGNTARGKGFLESEVIRNTLNPIKKSGQRIAKEMGDLKGKGLVEIYQKAKQVGNKATDRVIGGKADAESGRTGYEVRRDSVANALTKKITQINQDIAKHEASGGSAKKIAKLKSLRTSLEAEYGKSQIGPQGIQYKAEISELTKQIEYLKKIGGNSEHIKSLETLKGKKVQDLKKFKGDSKAVSRNYIRDGLHFAMISAATQGILNIVDQVRKGDDVKIGDAFDFITTPQFVMGTSGAFAGGLLVQKGLTTGFGKIAMSAVQNMLPGFLKPLAMTLPYMMGAMVGSELLTGTLGQRSVGQMAVSGIGSSVGMMLGSAIFPPFGSIVGAVLGGMVADHLMGGASSDDGVQTEVRMLYEPQWLEFSELSWTNEDSADMETALASGENDFVSYVTPVLDGLQSVEELDAAKNQAYESYTEAVEKEGPESQKAQNAYQLYEEIERRMQKFSKE